MFFSGVDLDMQGALNILLTGLSSTRLGNKLRHVNWWPV